MTNPPPLWGVVGLFASAWKLAIVAFGAYVVLGRRLGPFASRWLSPVAHTRASSAAPKASRWSFGDRVFLLLLVMAAAAVATIILARMTIAYPPRAATGP